MKTKEAIDKLINLIQDRAFSFKLFAYEGGTCGQGWDTSEDIKLSKDQLVYLIKQKLDNDQILDGIDATEIDIEEYIEDIAYELSWPNGGAHAYVQNYIPQEFEELASAIDNVDFNSYESVDRVVSTVRSISDTDCHFLFTIRTPDSSYYFAENVEVTIPLSSNEIKGLLKHSTKQFRVLFGDSATSLDENFINAKVLDYFHPSDYDYFSYGGECDSLENYLYAFTEAFNQLEEKTLRQKHIDLIEEYIKGKFFEQYEFDAWIEDQD